MNFERYARDVGAVMDSLDAAQIERLIDAIADAYTNGKFVFVIGNGGSGANASHLCEDLGKGTLSDYENQKRLRIISLTDNTPYILAWANDEGYERIFVEQLKNLASPGDLLIAISGSGNSPNILRAVEYANDNGIKTFALAGYDGGRLKRIAGDCQHVNNMNMGKVESVHGVIIHYLIDALRERFRDLDAAEKRAGR